MAESVCDIGTEGVVTRGGAPIPEASHSSETEVDAVPCDFAYTNDGTIEELSAAMVELFDYMAEGRTGR